MDTELPGDIAQALRRQTAVAKRARLRVRGEALDHEVLDLTDDGFVIAADGRPPLRGYADIFKGEDRVLHGLVVCSWAENGLVGYEFKRGTAAAPVAPDHVPPAHAGLLEGPSVP